MSVGELYTALTRGELDIAYASGLREQRLTQRPGWRQVTTVPFRTYHWFTVSSPRMAERIRAGGSSFTIFLPGYAVAMIPRIQPDLPATNEYHFTLAQDTEATKATALADLGIACIPAYTSGSNCLWVAWLVAFRTCRQRIRSSTSGTNANHGIQTSQWWLRRLGDYQTSQSMDCASQRKASFKPSIWPTRL